jgi:hypothetical protein
VWQIGALMMEEAVFFEKFELTYTELRSGTSQKAKI